MVVPTSLTATDGARVATVRTMTPGRHLADSFAADPTRTEIHPGRAIVDIKIQLKRGVT